MAGTTTEREAVPPGVVPRWEWRTFGEHFDAAEDLLATLSPQTIRTSEELYILSMLSDASVKIRDGLMDVKHLLRVNDDGLELWVPVLKTAFPLSGRRRSDRADDARHRRCTGRT